MTSETERKTELRIIKKVVDALLNVGPVSVNDGEEVTLRNSTNKKAILDAMQTTDEDYLLVGKQWVRLVYGNGEDVICDYSTSLEEVISPIV